MRAAVALDRRPTRRRDASEEPRLDTQDPGREDARERIASLLDAQADEILFTSGATEANNLAIFGCAGAATGTIVTSAIEHPSVSEPIRELAKTGFTLASLPVSQASACHCPLTYRQRIWKDV